VHPFDTPPDSILNLDVVSVEEVFLRSEFKESLQTIAVAPAKLQDLLEVRESIG
jgi:hypothetical protein